MTYLCASHQGMVDAADHSVLVAIAARSDGTPPLVALISTGRCARNSAGLFFMLLHVVSIC